MKPKTNIKVKLVGNDGNAFYILALVRKSLINNGHGDLAEQFIEEATFGDYDHLLQTCLKYVVVE